jgi:hypothetical protein
LEKRKIKKAKEDLAVSIALSGIFSLITLSIILYEILRILIS